MKTEDIEILVQLYFEGIKTYKEACDFILKQDTKINNELFLLLLAISDSMESLAILSRYNKMRDCYVTSRVIYETILNVLTILSTNFEAMDEMMQYTQDEIAKEPARSIATDSEAVFFTFDGNNHSVGFAKHNPIKSKNPRSWTKHNIPNQINLIDKKYGKVASRSLQVAHLTIYRTASNIAHGTLYGMLQAMGLIHGKEIKSFTDTSMIEHNQQVIATLLLTTLQSTYSLIYALDKEIGLEQFEKGFYETLGQLIHEGQKRLSNKSKETNQTSYFTKEDLERKKS
ncbi:hypothetical protein WCX18_03520 [Sulfurimonas sp. HSL1-2]|uniref:hypothetical protein n=1 Tax=Thiomicrolovo zhangzhouensis TaxID=3131933 RepID=UPI0031F9FD18